ncbi:TIR domain-containing protein [Pseudacidovorax intermedius]|uniref:TIR domain-containing protein n=1 Tax=Pseudacidovorax intermedius TaxID=433924 RepID=UPI0025FF568E|nr:TIR domain-containing protein [Pseudacidovorax intermedius]
MAKAPAKKVASAKKVAVSRPSGTAEKTRSYMSQEDIPAYDLDEAILVAKALLQEYGGHPATPLDVAAAMDLTPTSGKFRMLCGASIAYGLTTGGYNAAQIAPTSLARQIVEPQEEGAELAGKREAVMKPRILREFLSKYSGSPLPREDIGMNVLKGMNVPADRTKQVWDMVLRSADSVGFLQTIKERKYVNLGGVKPPEPPPLPSGEDGAPESPQIQIKELVKTVHEPEPAAVVQESRRPTTQNDARLRRVFITHGKNTAFIEPIKELLGFGELIPVVSIQKESVAQPVPDKVMNDMRGCGAAIIHVDGEMKLLDSDAKEHTVINPNVLIEIGAAMALYGRRFILLVRDGVKLPSNLQGLYEVRYQGDSLDGAVTIRLLKAINEMKAISLPAE